MTSKPACLVRVWKNCLSSLEDHTAGSLVERAINLSLVTAAMINTCIYGDSVEREVWSVKSSVGCKV